MNNIPYETFHKIAVSVFKNQSWYDKKPPSKKDILLGNRDTFFSHMPSQSIQSLCIRVGRPYEMLFRELACLSDNVLESEYSGKRISKVYSITARTGKKQIDLAFKYNGRLYIFEIKSNLGLDNKNWFGVISGIFANMQRIVKIENIPPSQIVGVVLGVNDENLNNKGKVLMAKEMISQENPKFLCEIHGWRWIMDVLGVEITSEQYYNTFARIGRMITQHEEWEDFENDGTYSTTISGIV